MLLLTILVLSTRSPENATHVLENWLRGGLPLVALALAAGLIISFGQIDIASGSIFSLVGMIVLALMHRVGVTTAVIFSGILIAWLTVILVYLLIYVLVVICRIPALLCTLGLAFCAKSVSVVLQAYLQSGSMTVPVDNWIRVFGWSFLWIPVVIGALLFWRLFLDSGLYHVALGADAKSAENARVLTRRVYFRGFLMSGVLVGLSSILFLVGFQKGGWQPSTGWGEELFAIAGAVIGGCRITGGRFEPVSIAIATILIVGVKDISGLFGSVELEYLLLGVGVIGVALLDFSDRFLTLFQRLADKIAGVRIATFSRFSIQRNKR